MSQRFFRPLSIKTRLMLAVMTSTVVASIVAGGLSTWREISSYAEAKRIEAKATASLFATMSAEAVSRGDKDRVHDSLRAMSSLPSVNYIRFDDRNGATLAEHGFGAMLVRREGDAATTGGLNMFSLVSGEPMAVSEPVIRGGERVGEVFMLVSTDDLQQRLASLLANVGMATALALAMGLLAAQRFRRGVSSRISSVSEAMAVVQRTHRYELALPNERADELGVLVEGFNDMMREIRRRDRKLAEHRDNLEREVDERTRDLQLAKRAADDANAAKSQFLSTMSHEIRTPLNGLLVMAELMAAADLASREKRYADVIVRTGGTLLAIINDVLDLSKIEAGKIELELIQMDVADMVDDVCQLFASKAAAQSLDLAAYIAPTLGPVIGDPVRIAQIVGNLVNNAIKFTSTGHVMVEAIEDPRRPAHILFSVTDTGIGIPAEKLGGVFESFSQADQSTTRKYGGTGLGLNICQRLVDVMQGEIGVESAVGRGSRFWFSIPLERIAPLEGIAGDLRPKLHGFTMSGLPTATAEALARYALAASTPSNRLVIADSQTIGALPAFGPQERVILLSRMGDGKAENLVAQGRAACALPWPVRRRDLEQVLDSVMTGAIRAPASHGVAASEARYSKARVLVADDNAVNREVAVEALKRFAIVPETAQDGEEAHAMAVSGGFGLSLMDGSMPVMDGFAASRAIRADEARLGHKRQPIVALTAFAMGDGLEEWRDAGMDGVLLKPFKLAQLAACLEKHLVADAAGAERLAAPIHSEPAAPPLEASDGTGLLDPETIRMLDQLAGVEAEPVQRIVGLFLEHAPPALARLAEDIAAGDSRATASAAHAMKSMALSVGARALAEDLAIIEKNARHGAVSSGSGTAADLERRFIDTKAALNDLPWMRVSQGPVERPLEVALA
ncbi:MAG: response regulator [Methylocystis sp.]|nr:response regulator [Methylocystis sp.]